MKFVTKLVLFSIPNHWRINIIIKSIILFRLECKRNNNLFCSNNCLTESQLCDLKPDCSYAKEEHVHCPDKLFNNEVGDCEFSSNFNEKENKNCEIRLNLFGVMKKKAHSLFIKRSMCKNPKCKKGYYVCAVTHYCIYIKHVCDGISHCFHGDDELGCSWVILIGFKNISCNRKRVFLFF